MGEGIAWGGLALRALKIVLIVYLLFAAFVWLYADRLVFLPQPAAYRASDALLRIPVGARDTLAALWLPNDNARYTLFFHHGNAEDLGDLRPFLEELRDAGFSVLAYDYRGYGLSTGRASERNAYADGAAAYAHLTGALGVPPERVIVHGRSLGGGVATHVAAREPVAGVVLESTFTSVLGVVPGFRVLPFDKFPSQARLRRVRAPVLVIHGTRDEVIPFAHAHRLHASAQEPKRHLWVEGAGHNDLAYVAGPRYLEALRAFAASLETGGRPPS